MDGNSRPADGAGPSLRSAEGAMLTVLSLLGLLATAGSLKLGLWDANGPSTGFLPACAGVMITLCAVASLPRRETSASEAFFGERAGARRVGAVLAAIVALAAGIPVFGFLATAVPVLTLLLIVVHRGRPVHAILVAGGAAIGIYLLFDKLLDALLPRGILGLI